MGYKAESKLWKTEGIAFVLCYAALLVRTVALRQLFIFNHYFRSAIGHNGWCYGAACVAPAASCIIARVISWLRLIKNET